ncbi:MAG: hypothetical protein ACYDA3_03730 [Gaiellaceae bacterium]
MPALAVAAFAALPAVAVWAGRRAAPSLRTADPKLILLAAALTAALAGAAVTLLVGGAAVLGRQLEAAPVPLAVSLAGLVLFPTSLALAAVAPAAILFAAPVEGWRTPIAFARLLGFAALGGAGAEALVAVARRSARGLPVAACVGLLAAAGAPLLLSPAAVLVWLAAAAARPPEPSRRGDVVILVRGVVATAAARYARRPDLRRQCGAACSLAVVGAIALRLADAGGAAALFGGFIAVVGAAVLPLAAPGLDRGAEWLWRTTPASRCVLALAFGAAAFALGTVVALVGAAGAFATGPVPVSRVVPLVAVLALVLASALLAGALVPWRAERLGEQLGAYAAFGICAGALWFALAHVAQLLGAEHGLRAAVLVAASASTCAAASALVQGVRT